MAETVVSVCFVVQPACIGAQGGGGGLSAFVESFAHLFTSVCAMASDYHSVEIVDRKPFSGMQNRVRALF